MRKRGLPEPGETVVCRITKLHPNSAFAEMIEYGKPGMIHVSEVARRWVRDIREFLSEGQYLVCKVVRIENDTVLLSVKRVDGKESARRLNQFNREKKAEKMLELAARGLKKDLNEAYEQVGYRLNEEFGSLEKAFEIAFKNPGLLKDRKVDAKWVDALAEVAKKSYTEKTYQAKVKLKLISYAPDGIGQIKKALEKAEFAVKYISAPTYMMVGTGTSYKDLEARLLEAAKGIAKAVEKSGGEAAFELVKE
ncbi:MAG: S1 RNA-binding domain-containing protein [Candidatus Aenigmarchaeota archaeon]|nr:S1 RNA-binding domain-containing protein [Candidatus Aenigmarchaeota archaeon]